MSNAPVGCWLFQQEPTVQTQLNELHRFDSVSSQHPGVASLPAAGKTLLSAGPLSQQLPPQLPQPQSPFEFRWPGALQQPLLDPRLLMSLHASIAAASAMGNPLLMMPPPPPPPPPPPTLPPTELKPTWENIRAYPQLFVDFQMRAIAKARELQRLAGPAAPPPPPPPPPPPALQQQQQQQQQQHQQQLTKSPPTPPSPQRLQQTVGEGSVDVESPASPIISSPSSGTVELQPSIIVNNNSKQQRFACDRCRRSYSTSAGLLMHKESGHCGISGSTSSISNGARPVDNSDSPHAKRFSCTRCHKVYFSLSALKMHIRTHTLPCQCKICGKAFSRMWLLNGHIRTHTGEKPFECGVCQRAFADRSNLRAHMQTHSEVKKYCCQACGKTFSRMGLLTKHRSVAGGGGGGCCGVQSVQTNSAAVSSLLIDSSGSVGAEDDDELMRDSSIAQDD